MLPKVKYLWLRAALLALTLAMVSSCNAGGDGETRNPTAPGGGRELDSGNISPSGTYQHRFAASGTYAYHCIYHTPMTGSVVVDANAPDTLARVSITSDITTFPAASVRPGGRVVWTNNMDMLHTVTSD